MLRLRGLVNTRLGDNRPWRTVVTSRRIACMSHTIANALADTARLRHVVVTMALALLASCGSPESLPQSSPPEPVPQINASRLFAGPDQYPPRDFAAYGILAFRSEATSQSQNRYLAICEGFLASLPAAPVLENRGVPMAEQMATVWPLYDGRLADDLNGTNTGGAPLNRCREIVAGIDIITSGDAISQARRASDGESLQGAGPFLIAWSPSTTFGQANVPVLVKDLSSVTTIQQATNLFLAWADDIQRNPDLWRGGWDLELLRETLRDWADRFGHGILSVIGLIGA